MVLQYMEKNALSVIVNYFVKKDAYIVNLVGGAAVSLDNSKSFCIIIPEVSEIVATKKTKRKNN